MGSFDADGFQVNRQYLTNTAYDNTNWGAGTYVAYGVGKQTEVLQVVTLMEAQLVLYKHIQKLDSVLLNIPGQALMPLLDTGWEQTQNLL